MGIRYKPRYFLLIILLFGSCVSRNHIPMGNDKRLELQQVFEKAPVLFTADYQNGEVISCGNVEDSNINSDYFPEEKYFPSLLSDMKFYLENAEITFEYLPVLGQSIGFYIIRPANTSVAEKGTLFFFHGYFDYAAEFHEFYEKLLSQGYTVVAADLPGHGVSTGSRGEINEFSDYGEFVESVVKKTAMLNAPQPWFGAGHSTGSAALVIHAVSRNKTPFSALFLGSPLGRSYCYGPAVVGSVLVKPFVFAISAKWKGDYSVNYVPISWFRAQQRWVKSHKHMSGDGLSNIPVLIAWGENDKTLDIKYSENFYMRIFPQAQQITFENAIHNLYVDKNKKEIVFDTAIEFFNLHYRP